MLFQSKNTSFVTLICAFGFFFLLFLFYLSLSLSFIFFSLLLFACFSRPKTSSFSFSLVVNLSRTVIITFRFLLYSPTTRPEDPRHISSSGQGQVEFAKYVAKDRHGGHLKGTALNDTGDGGSGGAPPGNYPCCTSHPIDIHSVARRHWW